MRKIPATTLALGVLALSGSAQAGWSPNHLYSVAGGTPYGVRDVSAGGDASAAPFVALPGRCPGQLAWSPDLTTMYATQFDANTVVAVDSSGTVTTFATGISGPTGLLMTRDGHLLVAAFFSNAVYDITAGGSFSAATPLATGTSGVRDLVQLLDGRVMAASQGTGEVDDIHYPTGGAATAFATGLSSVAGLAQKSTGQFFVSSYGGGKIFDITAGGNFSGATAYASGQSFMGLAVDGEDRLFSSQLGSTNIFLVTAGAATTFATNAPSGESGLGVAVAYPRIVTVTAEPNGANCVAGGTKIQVCFDTNNDGTCTAADASVSVQYVCDGVGDLSTITSLASGNAHCANGGTQIDSGLDNGDGGGTAGDGILQAGEIDSTQYVCNGTDGTDGTDGTNGATGSAGANGANGADGMDGKDGGCNAGGSGGAASGLLIGFMLVGLTRRSRRSVS